MNKGIPLTTAVTLLANGIFLTQTASADPFNYSRPLAPFPRELQERVKHIIIIYPENRGFDSLYGRFPGANGLREATTDARTQLQPTGQPYPTLPQPTTSGIPGISSGPDSRFPINLANGPYNQNLYITNESRQGDMVHRFYIEQYQINSKRDRFAADPNNAGGAPMSKFTAWSDNGGMVMGHVNAREQGEGRIAQDFALADNAFHSAFGGSFLNHQWLISSRTPVWPANPTDGGAPPNPTSATVFANGYPAVSAAGLSDGRLTNEAALPGFTKSNAAQTLAPGDYWCVNTTFPLRGPAGGINTIAPIPPPPSGITQPTVPTSDTPIASRLPLQTYDNIGDRLDSKNLSWAWYSQGWNDAKAGNANYLFQFHHQPFAFFAKTALAKTPVPATATSPAVPGVDSDGSRQHLKDFDSDFLSDLRNGTVPAVAFIKPIGQTNEHPGYSTVRDGQDFIYQTVRAIQNSSIWQDTVVFVMYDEHGGLWDHVEPPAKDPWGPGSRVPLVIASPFAKNGFVDHTSYETVSLLSFIEKVYRLPSLNDRDAKALPPVSAFKGQPDLIARATAGQPFTYTLPAYNRPVIYGIYGASDGLILNPFTGELSGTPRAAGSYELFFIALGYDGYVFSSFRLDVSSPGADLAAY